VTSWAGSVQGPYPVGNPSAQPDQRFAFPSAETGAKDQTFRLILRPSIWGKQARMRFSNAFGTQPVTIDGAFVGLQLGGPALVKGTNRQITFAGKTSVIEAIRYALDRMPDAQGDKARYQAIEKLLLLGRLADLDDDATTRSACALASDRR